MPDSSTLGVNSISDEETDSIVRVQGALSFIALCQITVILGEILPLIYTLQPQGSGHAFRALRRHETALDEWEEKLPTWLRPSCDSFNRQAIGALNLQLCYLVLKMCLWTIGLLVRLSPISITCSHILIRGGIRRFIGWMRLTSGTTRHIINRDAGKQHAR